MILGIGALIEKEEDFDLCGSSNDPLAFLDKVKETRSDAVVLDIALYTKNSIGLINKLRENHPDIAIVILSVHRQVEYMQKALDAGANAYVLKTDNPRNLITAIRAALAGETYRSEKVETTSKEPARISDSPINELSRREFEILQEIGKGLTSRQIAQNRSMRPQEVDEDIKKIGAKLDLRTSAELLQFAVHWVHHEGGFH